MVQTGSKSEAIRQALPVTRRAAYFNTGTCGPLPQACADALAREDRREIEEGRIGMASYLAFRDLKESLRAGIAKVLGCDTNEVAITHNTTEGINYAIWGMNWNEGDEVLTTNVEHIGGLAPLYLLEQRHGIKLTIADCGPTGEGALEALSARLTERTRAVVLSHVSYATGYVLPLKAISQRAHAVGAMVIVDGAQSVGAIPLDMHDLEADAYAGPGQKWLCGPEGTGVLYIAAAKMDSFGASFAGYSSFETFDELGGYTPHGDARRFELGSVFRPGLAGLKESVDWIVNDVTLEWATERISTLQQYCRKALEGIEGVEIVTPVGRQAGLVTFTVPAWEPAAVVEELGDRQILIRSIGRPSGLRVSTGFYNTEEEIDALVAGVKEVMQQTPRPPRITFH
ncbi:MAG: aminotransferase class V-fold PLP-dependent enzyme [Dehalococcoidia bacterium]